MEGLEGMVTNFFLSNCINFHLKISIFMYCFRQEPAPESEKRPSIPAPPTSFTQFALHFNNLAEYPALCAQYFLVRSWISLTPKMNFFASQSTCRSTRLCSMIYWKKPIWNCSWLDLQVSFIRDKSRYCFSTITLKNEQFERHNYFHFFRILKMKRDHSATYRLRHTRCLVDFKICLVFVLQFSRCSTVDDV